MEQLTMCVCLTMTQCAFIDADQQCALFSSKELGDNPNYCFCHQWLKKNNHFDHKLLKPFDKEADNAMIARKAESILDQLTQRVHHLECNLVERTNLRSEIQRY